MAANQNASASRKIRYAVVGLGWFAQAAALPSFDHAENSELVAIVSDDPTKRDELGKQYNIQRTYSYEQYEDCLNSGEVDAVYIALPNHLHREYTVRAANAGVHILCEKPMAVTVDECEAMIQAAKDNHVKLMIAYRLHLEEANLQAVETVRSGKIGEPRIFNSVFTQQTVAGNIRLEKDKGGGTLDDVGVYCINAVRYLFQDEPIEVFATSANNGEERFSEVDEMTSAILRFPDDRLAAFTVSFGGGRVATYQVVGTKGDLRVDSAYGTQGEIKHTLTIDGEKQERSFAPHDQIAAEFVYFSDCILQNKEPEPSGQEGLIDVQIIRALYRSIETGSFVKLDTPDRQQRPTADQTIERPPVQEQPELVHAADPSGKS
ncbi:gfo/Idh/MocA family oxidoreductase [Phormidesmis priestleyi ULC007]|uniref:Gfo/Idh/MocA family oxidoreductase n=1 Tax=Phormidesmis priestleyi ULC007 TaxID=1920490 RepID=A0A2T1D9Q4_9CYAN|nr:Gfo/Idh/MocA family oxidoreductase [Phormidesmis priestleyi]PSB17196.1 gfo/Idh/MocA family oxidoreductase [Phormidesmis priestleyi ULC007]PZO47979.1 MAG: gfo/Idh/MocA family oxidoreductase [Phormidesmis priestleyi]